MRPLVTRDLVRAFMGARTRANDQYSPQPYSLRSSRVQDFAKILFAARTNARTRRERSIILRAVLHVLDAGRWPDRNAGPAIDRSYRVDEFLLPLIAQSSRGTLGYAHPPADLCWAVPF